MLQINALGAKASGKLINSWWFLQEEVWQLEGQPQPGLS
jgi:hypothetical protein